MDKFTDAYIRNGLRDWTAQYHPPASSRARLFWEVCRLKRYRKRVPAPPLFPKAIIVPNVNYPVNELSRAFADWSIIHHARSGIQVLV